MPRGGLSGERKDKGGENKTRINYSEEKYLNMHARIKLICAVI